MNELERFYETFSETLNQLGEALTDPMIYTPNKDFKEGIEFSFEKVKAAFEFDYIETSHAPKPPLGVVPEHIHDSNRAEVLRAAMQRYLEDSTQAIPFAWFKEYNVLINKLESSPY